MAFWVSNPKIRQRWYKLILNRKIDNNDDDITANSNINHITVIDELTRNSIDEINSITVSLIDRNSYITNSSLGFIDSNNNSNTSSISMNSQQKKGTSIVSDNSSFRISNNFILS